MIDSVIKDVREAEEKAELMSKQAYQRGKDIILKAEAEATAQKKATVAECKADRAEALNTARKAADMRTQAILKKGASDADYLVEEKSAEIVSCADEVVEAILNKYVKEQTLQD